MSVHLSFSRSASLALAWGDRSGLLVIEGLRDFRLARMLLASAALTSSTLIGRGLTRFSLKWPSREQSLIECFCKSSSISMRILVTLSRSLLALLYHGVPLGHSSTPKMITLDLRCASVSVSLLRPVLTCELLDWEAPVLSEPETADANERGASLNICVTPPESSRKVYKIGSSVH